MFETHFSKSVVSSLSRKGITICGGQAVKTGSDWTQQENAYALVKNGCQYLRKYSEVLAIANGKTELLPS